ncbi:LysR family transcriptional regulator [Solirubrobacter phytolaccae]|uniref:LysR family transcriptional regulator n=1 Tax=Solirubrobacter phytolaccae TaxID=1404360 RepID=A0A9X3NQC9_9ACTN|nr:LysR substrate-binding domain-containing protein [Solirubrobacter phytolaccae]MDA0185547.1 LysR family transcriptional regulator [Solirubrobacter phytolaccae]
MDPRRVLTFRAVAHERSFSAAARALSLTQPAVSQQVAALERELGARLLDREHAMALTPAGEVLLAHADAIAERFALAERQLAELAVPPRLRIGAFPSALAALVPRAVARLGAAAGEPPSARAAGALGEVILEEGTTPELADRVGRGELHLALGFQDATLERREHDGVERRDLLQETFLVALPPGHRLAALDAIPLTALAEERWIAPSGNNLIARACAAAGFEMQLSMVSRDPLANRGVIAAGLAVTLVPRLGADGFHGLELRPIEGEGPRRDVYALLPRGGRHPQAEDAWDALVEVASAFG